MLWRAKFPRLARQFSVSPQTIVDKCHDVRSSIQLINDKYKGPLQKTSQKNTILPFVFLLGNHSSGKSSFINYILQRKVQVTGVAPTDDTFTIIVSGASDGDRDGPAFIGDPDMGFSGLRTFGPQLIHHTQLKVRSNTAVKDFMIVDSPGMIDSPHVNNIHVPRNMDRGYDFEGVCRWYAERADVILLFFDPDKPGTTGETLSILTNSLVGLEHKLHIILNKADQFRKIHDFARAYGSLCWNLSKVIQRKDLPRIYTMCLPSNYHAVAGGDTEGATLGNGVIDLEAAREDVVAEVFNAPKRRVDNEVTRLADSLALLQMHMKIIADVQSQYRGRMWEFRGLQAAASALSVGLPAGLIAQGLLTPEVGIAGGTTGLIIVAIANFLQSRILTRKAEGLIQESSLESSFKKQYTRKIAEKDEDTLALWSRAQEFLRIGLTGAELQAMPKVTKDDIATIDRILENDVPNLRRQAGPNFNRS